MPIRQGQMHTHCMVHADSDTLDIERSQSLSGMSVEHERFSHEGPFSKDSVYDLEKLVIVQYKRRHCIHEEFTSPARSVEWERHLTILNLVPACQASQLNQGLHVEPLQHCTSTTPFKDRKEILAEVENNDILQRP